MSKYHDDADFAPTKGSYKTLRPFRAWVQKVLPQAYDDSLSYAELLYKVLSVLNAMIENMETFDDEMNDLLEAYNLLQNFVNEYFDSLDYEAIIEDKVDELVTTGEFRNLFRDTIASNVSAWLAANVDPTTGYVLDASLTASDAAAPAKTVGDRLKEVFDYRGSHGVTLSAETDFNDITTIGNYNATPAATAATMLNSPTTSPGRLCVIQGTIGTRRIQIYMTNTSTVRFYTRFFDDTKWSAWQQLGAGNAYLVDGSGATIIKAGYDIDELITPGNYKITSGNTAAEVENLPISKAGRLTVVSYTGSDNVFQFYATNTASGPSIYYRYGASDDTGTTWTRWRVINATFVDRRQIKILLVGNSYSINAGRYLCRYLYDSGYDAIVGQWYYGGSTLKQQYDAFITESKVNGQWFGTHLYPYWKYVNSVSHTVTNDCTLSYILEDEPWDVVVFQQKAIEAGRYVSYVSDSFDIKTFQTLIAERIGKEVRNIRWGLMLPWNYPDDFEAILYEEYYNSDPEYHMQCMKTVTYQVADYLTNTFIVNVGIGIEKGRQNIYLNAIGDQMNKPWKEEDGQIVPDRAHLAPGIPKMLASMIYASTITGISPYEMRYQSTETLDVNIQPSPFLNYLAQVCCEYAIQWMLTVTGGDDIEERVETLENTVSSQQTAITGKVDRSGDSMTGYLRMVNYGFETEETATNRVAVGSASQDGYRLKYIAASADRFDSGGHVSNNTPKLVMHGQWGVEGTGNDNLYDYQVNLISTIADTKLIDTENASFPLAAASDGALDALDSIPVKKYQMLGGKRVNYGILGADAYAVDNNLAEGSNAEGRFWCLDTQYMLALIVKAIQELKAEVDAL